MKNYKPNPFVAWLALGLFLWVTTIFMWIFGNFRWQYAAFVNLLWQFYIGYSISIGWIIIGFLRAVIDWFCSAFILVRLYNVIYKVIKK